MVITKTIQSLHIKQSSMDLAQFFISITRVKKSKSDVDNSSLILDYEQI